MQQLLLLNFFFVFLLFLAPARAINTLAEGFQVNNSATINIDAHSTSCDVTNTSGSAQFVATKTAAEWQSFRDNLPTGMSTSNCSTASVPGYFVLSSGTTNGNFGDLATADGTCFTEVTTTSWLDKANAGTITASRVKAFLCDSTTCNDLQPSTTYAFATAGDTVGGGATMTSDGAGLGPNDTGNWADATHFNVGGTTGARTGRAAGTNSVWGSATDGNHCVNWSNSTGGQSGTTGIMGRTDSTRWNAAAPGCQTNQRYICMVHPPDVTVDAINWADFNYWSTTETISGINTSVDLEISAVNGVGAPTLEYRKNGGSWTVFTTISPATVSVVDGDTLRFRATGTVGNTATITVTNTSDSNTVIDTMVATADNPPPIGYFVSAPALFGVINYGSKAGADALCVTELTNKTFLGKENATIDAAHVKAFLCDSGGCNNLQANTTYYFARAGSATVGGASFTTNGSGAGPNDSANWSGATYFGSTSIFAWTGRSAGTATTWGLTPSADTCLDWGSASNSDNGSYGWVDQTGSGRWNAQQTCGAGGPSLICYVDP